MRGYKDGYCQFSRHYSDFCGWNCLIASITEGVSRVKLVQSSNAQDHNHFPNSLISEMNTDTLDCIESSTCTVLQYLLY